MRIDEFMPQFHTRVVHDAVVRASPADTMAAVQDTNLLADRPVVWLTALRDLPRRIGAALRQKPFEPIPPEARFRDLGPPDWVRLADEPAVFVGGAVGVFWRPVVEFVPVAAEDFASYAEPGHAKTALALSVEDLGDGRSRLTYESRTTTTDAAARRRFRLYWLVVGPFASLMMRRALVLIRREAERTSKS